MDKQSEDPEHKVGYGSPPLHTRFKKGRSGNSLGRKPKPRTVDGILLEMLDEKIVVKMDGFKRLMPLRYALARGWLDRALKGDVRMSEHISKIDREATRAEPFTLTRDDEAEFDRMIRSAIQEFGDAAKNK